MYLKIWWWRLSSRCVYCIPR